MKTERMKKMKIDARGKQCPLPVIEAKNALKDAEKGEVVEILVDNESCAAPARWKCWWTMRSLCRIL